MMTPAERRALINRPFPVVRFLTTSYPHAGTLIVRDPDPNTLKKRLADGDTLSPTEDVNYDVYSTPRAGTSTATVRSKQDSVGQTHRQRFAVNRAPWQMLGARAIDTLDTFIR